MSERTLRIITGLLILIALYLELPELIIGLIVVMLFEGITNWRIPVLFAKLQGHGKFENSLHLDGTENDNKRFDFEAERAMRFLASFLLWISYFGFNEQLWFFPWFMGFAFFGAGISGVCPMLIGLKKIGFN